LYQPTGLNGYNIPVSGHPMSDENNICQPITSASQYDTVILMTGHPISDGLLSDIRFTGCSMGDGDNSTTGQFV